MTSDCWPLREGEAPEPNAMATRHNLVMTMLAAGNIRSAATPSVNPVDQRVHQYAALLGGSVGSESIPARPHTMPAKPEQLTPIVTADLSDAAQKVIQQTKRNTPYSFFLDAKLGNADTAPLTDAQMAAAYHTPLSTANRRLANAISVLARTDQELDHPLETVAQRADAVMGAAAIINRQNRRPPLYSESTIRTLVELGYAEPEHAPIIRAAGYVAPPPTVSTDHGIDFVIVDIATHLSRSHEPQSPEQILEALPHRRGALDRWPRLDVPLFIRRVAGIVPDDAGHFNPDQPWGKFIGRQQLVENTIIRVLSRDGQPRCTQYLADEITRLVGHLLPDGYNTRNAIRNVTKGSDEISWQGLATFGLTRWETGIGTQNTGHRRSTSDLIYAFLVNDGPADIDDVTQYVQRTTKAKKRTVANAINHDPENRFIRMDDRRIAANPIPLHHNPDGPALTVIPDARQQGPVLRESELVWLTRYVQELNELTPPLPCRVAITGPRAAGIAHEGDTLEITVVAEPRHQPDIEPKPEKASATATEAVPAVRPKIRFVSHEQWNEQHGQTHEAFHNIWLPPSTAPRPDAP